MEIAINGKTDIASAEEGASLGRILSEIRVFVRNNGLVVSHLVLDGKEISATDQAAMAAEPVARFSRLEVTAANPADISGDVLVGLAEMMPRLASNVEAAADQIRVGKVSEGMETFGRGIEGWGAIQDSLRRIGALLSLDYGQTQAAGQTESIEARLRHLAGVLARTRDAMDAADFVTVGDILEYDIRPLVTEWTAILADLHTRVQKPI